MGSYKVTQARRKRGKLGTRGNAPEGAERKKEKHEKKKMRKTKIQNQRIPKGILFFIDRGFFSL